MPVKAVGTVKDIEWAGLTVLKIFIKFSVLDSSPAEGTMDLILEAADLNQTRNAIRMAIQDRLTTDFGYTFEPSDTVELL